MTGANVVKTATRIVTRKTHAGQELNTEICVVGAGIAGVSAALEAKRLGYNVTLIDASLVLGGQAVNSMIHMFCGLFSNGPEPYQLTHGIADDILHDLGQAGVLHYRRGDWTTVMYDVVSLSRWIEEAVRNSGITVILGGMLRGVIREDRRIRSVDIATRYGDMRVNAAKFVDATGDATLTWLAGLPCRESADGQIFGSHMMVVEGVDFAKLPPKEEFAVRLKEKGPQYGLVRAKGQVFPFPPRKLVTVNLTHDETPLDPVEASRQTLLGKAQAERILNFLRSEFSAFSNAHARAFAQPGIRQTRWIVGRHHLTLDEVRAGTFFPDAVARTSWAVEIHDTLEGYYWEDFPVEHIHYVPFGSLTPPDVDNLVAVGRCLDGDVAAHSSVRVMGPCIAMGAAAAHAFDLAGSGSVHDVDPAKLQERVKDNVTRTY